MAPRPQRRGHRASVTILVTPVRIVGQGWFATAHVVEGRVVSLEVSVFAAIAESVVWMADALWGGSFTIVLVTKATLITPIVLVLTTNAMMIVSVRRL